MPNISRSKGNQTMQFGQSVECNTKNFFLEKSCTKCGRGREVGPRPNYKKALGHISGSTFWNVTKFAFTLVNSRFTKPKYIKAKVLTITFTLCKAFLKRKRGLELVSLPHFLHDFWRKIFLMLYFINWPSFIAWFLLLLEMWGNICIVSICCPVYHVTNFEINRSFDIKPFFYITKKSGQNENISRTKKAFNIN